MTKEGARLAFGPAALAADLGIDEWDLVAHLTQRGRRSAEAHRLHAAVAGFVQQLAIAGHSAPEIAEIWHLSAAAIIRMIEADPSLQAPVGGADAAAVRSPDGHGPPQAQPMSRWPWPEADLQTAEAVWTHCSLDGVSRALGTSKQSVAIVLEGRGHHPELLRMRAIRDAAFVRLRWAGFALDTIASDWGVTRERVRQIVHRAGGPTNAELAAVRARAAETARQADEEAAMLVLAAGKVDNVNDLATALNWPESRVKAALPARVRSVLAHKKPAGSGRHSWSSDDVLAILRAASEVKDGDVADSILTGDAYDQLKDDLGGPSRATIAKMFGSWNEALDAAGLRTRTGKPKSSRHSDERLWDYLVKYVSDESVTSVTFHGFDDWRRIHAPSAPTAQVVRARLGPWAKIRVEALHRASTQRPADSEADRDLSEFEYWAAEETLSRVQAAGGNPADPVDYDRSAMDGAPSARRLECLFGSWGLALGALGWDPTEFVSTRVRLSDGDALGQLGHYVTSFVEATGRAPTSQDWESDRDASTTVGPWSYVRRFGSWRDSLEAVGVEADLLPPRFNAYAEEDMLRLLRPHIEASGGVLSMEAWDASRPANAPSGGTYIRRFGSWTAALDRALHGDDVA